MIPVSRKVCNEKKMINTHVSGNKNFYNKFQKNLQNHKYNYSAI